MWRTLNVDADAYILYTLAMKFHLKIIKEWQLPLKNRQKIFSMCQVIKTHSGEIPSNQFEADTISMCQSNSIDISFDKMIQSKLFRKQFQSSVINLLKWFWFKINKRFIGHWRASDIHISIYRFFYAKHEHANESKTRKENGIIIENLVIHIIIFLFKIILTCLSLLFSSLLFMHISMALQTAVDFH